MVNGDADVSKKKTELKAPDTPEAMLEIIERAQSGDEKAMPALRELLDRVPSIREGLGADLDRTVEYSISKSLGGADNLAFRDPCGRNQPSPVKWNRKRGNRRRVT